MAAASRCLHWNIFASYSLKYFCDDFSYVEVSDEGIESCQHGAIDERLKNNEKEIAALKETVKNQQKTMNNLEQKLERNQFIMMKFLGMSVGADDQMDAIYNTYKTIT